MSDLESYGRHFANCKSGRWRIKPCTCGLDAAIAREAASSAREARLREALEDLLRWDETGVRAFEVEDYAEAIQNARAALADPPHPVEACAECGHLAGAHYNGCSGFMRIAAGLQPSPPAPAPVERKSRLTLFWEDGTTTNAVPTKEQHMQPSVGRVVHYRLTLDDSYAIARRRTTGSSIADRIKDKAWPLGAQAHIGNPVNEGDVLPLIISRVWPDEYGPGVPGLNGQVLLDGNDQLWVTSVKEGDGPGQWTWPPRV